MAALILYGALFGVLIVALGQYVLGGFILAVFAWAGWSYFGPRRPVAHHRHQPVTSARITALGRAAQPTQNDVGQSARAA